MASPLGVASTSSKEFHMLLNIRIFGIHRPVECLLSMGPPHIGTLSPFHLNQVPGLFSGPCSLHTKSSDVRTIKSDVSSDKLVMKGPFIVTRFGGVNWGRIGGSGC